VPPQSAADLGDYYRAITMLEKVLTGGDERRWLLKMPDTPPATENLIYLGCNIFKTLHLVQTLTMLLDSLGVDYLAVGGPAFCCGIVHRRAGNLAAGERMFERSHQGFAGFQPKTLVNWCPSCEERLDEMVPDLSVLPYEVMHFTQLLTGLLDKVQWKRPVALKCALHAHSGSENSDRETAFAEQILGMIPGLELVELSSCPELGAHCSAARVSGLGRPKFRELIEAQVAESTSLGADALVSVYHSCHRELARYAEGQLEVLNYTTLIARALDLPEPEDRYQRYINEDFDTVAGELLPLCEAEGIRRDIAERVLRAEFCTR
jgi:Fe-S oxidoreductase